MKKLYFTALTLFFAAAVCAQPTPYKGTVMFSNGSAREENDSLKVSFDVRVDRAAVRTDRGMHLSPVLGTSEQNIALPDLMILGKNRGKSERRSVRLLGKKDRAGVVQPAAVVRVNKMTDTAFTYTWAAPYEPWMDDAGLAVSQELIAPGNKRELVFFSLADRVQLAPRTPYRVRPMLNYYIPAPEQKQRKKQGQAYLDFPVNKTTILPNYRNNPAELLKIRDAFGEIQNNPDVKITGLFIEGYASPDGTYDNNERLAHGRSLSFKNYITSNFRLPIGDESIKVEWTAEDWDGLVQLVQASDIGHKDEILRIIESTPIQHGRENALMRLAGGVPYRTMLKDMFPQLRRVEYQIDYSVKDYTPAEAKALISKNSFMFLSQRELFLTAQTYDPQSPEYSAIFLDIIPRQYPDDVTAAVNAAAVLIARGETATAKRYLEKWASDPQSWNDLGVVYLIEGDLDRAEELLKRAQTNGVAEASHNLAELAKKREDNVRMERYKNR